MNFAGTDVNLSVELKLNMIVSLEGVGVAREGNGLRLQVEFEIFRLHVRYGYGEVDEVLGGVSLAGALSPQD